MMPGDQQLLQRIISAIEVRKNIISTELTVSPLSCSAMFADAYAKGQQSSGRYLRAVSSMHPHRWEDDH